MPVSSWRWEIKGLQRNAGRGGIISAIFRRKRESRFGFSQQNSKFWVKRDAIQARARRRLNSWGSTSGSSDSASWGDPDHGGVQHRRDGGSARTRLQGRARPGIVFDTVKAGLAGSAVLNPGHVDHSAIVQHLEQMSATEVRPAATRNAIGSQSPRVATAAQSESPQTPLGAWSLTTQQSPGCCQRFSAVRIGGRSGMSVCATHLAWSAAPSGRDAGSGHIADPENKRDCIVRRSRRVFRRYAAARADPRRRSQPATRAVRDGKDPASG